MFFLIHKATISKSRHSEIDDLYKTYLADGKEDKRTRKAIRIACWLEPYLSTSLLLTYTVIGNENPYTALCQILSTKYSNYLWHH